MLETVNALPTAANLLCVSFKKNFLEDKAAAENANLEFLAFSVSYIVYLGSLSNKISFIHDDN